VAFGSQAAEIIVGDSSGERTRKLLARCVAAEVPSPARLVLLVLQSHFNVDEVGARPGLETIATETGLGRRTVIRALDRLVRASLVEIGKRPKAGGGFVNFYTIVSTESDDKPDATIRTATAARCQSGTVSERHRVSESTVPLMHDHGANHDTTTVPLVHDHGVTVTPEVLREVPISEVPIEVHTPPPLPPAFLPPAGAREAADDPPAPAPVPPVAIAPEPAGGREGGPVLTVESMQAIFRSRRSLDDDPDRNIDAGLDPAAVESLAERIHELIADGWTVQTVEAIADCAAAGKLKVEGDNSTWHGPLALHAIISWKRKTGDVSLAGLRKLRDIARSWRASQARAKSPRSPAQATGSEIRRLNEERRAFEASQRGQGYVRANTGAEFQRDRAARGEPAVITGPHRVSWNAYRDNCAPPGVHERDLAEAMIPFADPGETKRAAQMRGRRG
jgi:hypothetical protein